MKYLVVLDSRLSFQDYIPVAKELDLKICFISSKKELSEENKSIFDLYIYLEFVTEKSVIETLQSHDILDKVSLFWTYHAVNVGLCHSLNENLLKNPRFSTVLSNKTQNKYLMRKSLTGTGFNPEFLVIDTTKDFTNSSLFNWGFSQEKCVIKPFLGYSSIGVQLVRSEKEFVPALIKSRSVLSEIRSKVTNVEEGEFESTTHLLVEEFLNGPEFSLEIFGHDGILTCLSICQKSPMTEPFFEEITYQMPANLEEKTKFRLEKAGCQIMQTLGLKSGIAHLEVIDSPTGVKALDVGLRLGGSGLTHQLYENSTGCNLVKAVIFEALGLDPLKFFEHQSTNTSLLFLQQVGTGGKIESLPQASQINLPEGVELVDSETMVSPGETLTSYPKYSGLPGYALFKIQGRAAEAQHAISDLIQLCETGLKIQYSKD